MLIGKTKINNTLTDKIGITYNKILYSSLT